MDPNKPTNGWYEWSRWVLKNIEQINNKLEQMPSSKDLARLTCCAEALENDIQDLEKKIVRLEVELKIKAGIWGAIGAAIPVIALILLKILGEIP